MKIRTDFVTNSSSSSYIFNVGDLSSVKKAVKEAISKRLSDEYNEACHGEEWEMHMFHEDQKWFEERYGFENEFNWMNEDLKPLGEFDHHVIDEVYCWYKEEIIDIAILGLDGYMASEQRTGDLLFFDLLKIGLEQENEYNAAREKLRKEVMKEHITRIKHKELSEDSIARLVGTVILEYYSIHYDFEGEEVVFGEKTMQDILSDFLADYTEYSKVYSYEETAAVLTEFFLSFYESFPEIAKGFYGMKEGEILEKVMGNCYMHFEEYEWPNIYLEDALAGLPICVMWCRHMG